MLRPEQQVHFSMEPESAVWCVSFRKEFLTPLGMSALPDNTQVGRALRALPTHMLLDEDQQRALSQSVQQLHGDMTLSGQSPALQSLLRLQLYSLLLRLRLAQVQPETGVAASVVSMQLFKKFEKLVERKYHAMHQVAAYAHQLGCSEKSVNRATLDVLGIHAKAFIASRINSEAKRLLVETALPLVRVAEQLGFNEVSNFSKFFKREVGLPPAEFRRQRST